MIAGSPYAYLKAHQRAVALILALTCKAVGAVEIAGVSYVQAESLDDLAVVLVIASKAFVLVDREELARRLECRNIVKALVDLSFVYVVEVGITLEDSLNYLLGRVSLIHFDNIVSDLVDGVYRSACCVEHDIVSVKLILMYHNYSIFKIKTLSFE